MFKDKTVLITGETGSFGRWILKDILRNSVKELHILSRDEEKQLDVKREANNSRIKFFIGDVRDYDRVAQACRGVDILYHAAAQKIIDACEESPIEAFKTNVLGSWNVKKGKRLMAENPPLKQCHSCNFAREGWQIHGGCIARSRKLSVNKPMTFYEALKHVLVVLTGKGRYSF